jgi:hypothetical protein
MDDAKKALNDFVNDLHSRNLAIPAALLILLIVGAMILLPKKSSTTPTAAETAPAQSAEPQVTRAAVAQLVLANGKSIDESELLRTFGSVDPFSPKGNAFDCQIEYVLGVRVVTCKIGGFKVIADTVDDSPSSGTGPVDIVIPPDDEAPDDGDDLGDEPAYVVDVTLDGKTYKDLEAGDGLPESGIPVLFYAGVSSSGKSAMFLVAEGTSVQGADYDADLGVFTVQEGDSVVLTDELGTVFQFKLKDISKKS